MNKKSIIALTAAAAITVGLGAGSLAWFTSTATSTGNKFTTGTLNITQQVEGWKDVGQKQVAVDNMQPGDQKILPFTISNGTSTLGLKYKIELKAETPEDGVPNLLDVARFELKLNGESLTSDITFDGLKTYLAGKIKVLDANNHTPDSYEIVITIPEETDNTYMGGQGTFEINTKATQVDANANFGF